MKYLGFPTIIFNVLNQYLFLKSKFSPQVKNNGLSSINRYLQKANITDTDSNLLRILTILPGLSPALDSSF